MNPRWTPPLHPCSEAAYCAPRETSCTRAEEPDSREGRRSLWIANNPRLAVPLGRKTVMRPTGSRTSDVGLRRDCGGEAGRRGFITTTPALPSTVTYCPTSLGEAGHEGRPELGFKPPPHRLGSAGGSRSHVLKPEIRADLSRTV